MLIGMNLYLRTGRDNAADELVHGVTGRLGEGAPMSCFEPCAMAFLPGPHRSRTTQRGFVEAVDEVRVAANEEVQVEGPVVTGFHRAKAVENQRLPGKLGPEAFVKEDAVASESSEVACDRRVRGAGFVGDLTKARAGERAIEDRPEELGATQPVGGREGL